MANSAGYRAYRREYMRIYREKTNPDKRPYKPNLKLRKEKDDIPSPWRTTVGERPIYRRGPLSEEHKAKIRRTLKERKLIGDAEE